MLIVTPNTATVNVSTTPIAVSNGTYILLTNSNGREALINLFKANTTNLVGSFVLSPNTMIGLVKGADETINASPNVAATAVKVRI
jgi:hypothetical protein